MGDDRTHDTDVERTQAGGRLTRRPFLRGAAGVVVGSLGVTALASSAGAQSDSVRLDVQSTINPERGGVIPAVVELIKGDSPCLLPVPDNLVAGPRFGPTRLFQCDDPDPPELFQNQDDTLCALQEAIDSGAGATPVHGNGHRQGDQSVMFHFRAREAGFAREDIDDNGTVDVTLIAAVEDEDGVVRGVAPMDLVSGVAPMD